MVFTSGGSSMKNNKTELQELIKIAQQNGLRELTAEEAESPEFKESIEKSRELMLARLAENQRKHKKRAG